MEKSIKPLFETHALATYDRAKSTFCGRGTEYGDTWRETRFLKMTAVAKQLGCDIKPEHFRALATAAFCDMKYWRFLGGYKDDSLIDGMNYDAFLAEEVKAQESAVNAELGDWHQTFSGLAFYHRAPSRFMIRINDIAHALSMTCRFGGHVGRFYSVAQHSVLVSRIVPPEFAKQALLHDATEAYIGDMVDPVKREMTAFQRLEDRIWAVIAEKYELPIEMAQCVKEADLIALATERRDLMGPAPQPWHIDELGINPLPEKIKPLNPKAAERSFMKRWFELHK